MKNQRILFFAFVFASAISGRAQLVETVNGYKLDGCPKEFTKQNKGVLYTIGSNGKVCILDENLNVSKTFATINGKLPNDVENCIIEGDFVNEDGTHLTQTLFNDDEKWEYFVTDEIQIAGNYKYITSVYNEDGDCLGTIDGIISYIILSNGKKFIAVEDDEDSVFNIYCMGNGIDGLNANSVKMVKDSSQAKEFTYDLSGRMNSNRNNNRINIINGQKIILK